MTTEDRVAELEARVERLAEVLTVVVGVDRKALTSVIHHLTGRMPDSRQLITFGGQELKDLIRGDS